jgi:hypothetical protein
MLSLLALLSLDTHAVYLGDADERSKYVMLVAGL